MQTENLSKMKRELFLLYFSSVFFFDEEKKDERVCLCALLAHTMRFNLNINNANAVRSIQQDYHTIQTHACTPHIDCIECMWIVEALMQLKSNEDKEWAKEL